MYLDYTWKQLDLTIRFLSLIQMIHSFNLNTKHFLKSLFLNIRICIYTNTIISAQSKYIGISKPLEVLVSFWIASAGDIRNITMN